MLQKLVSIEANQSHLLLLLNKQLPEKLSGNLENLPKFPCSNKLELENLDTWASEENNKILLVK